MQSAWCVVLRALAFEGMVRVQGTDVQSTESAENKPCTLYLCTLYAFQATNARLTTLHIVFPLGGLAVDQNRAGKHVVDSAYLHLSLVMFH